MKPLDRAPETSSDGLSPVVEAQRTNTVRRIAGVVGGIVSVGSDIVTESGKLGMYAAGRVAHGIGEVRRAASEGLSGNDYPTGQ